MSQPEKTGQTEVSPRPFTEKLSPEEKNILNNLGDSRLELSQAISNEETATAALHTARTARAEAEERSKANKQGILESIRSSYISDFQKASMISAIKNSDGYKDPSELVTIAEGILETLNQINGMVMKVGRPLLLVRGGKGGYAERVEFFTSTGDDMTVKEFGDENREPRFSITVNNEAEAGTSFIKNLDYPLLANAYTKPEDIDSPEFCKLLSSRDVFTPHDLLVLGDEETLAKLAGRLLSDKDNPDVAAAIALSIRKRAKDNGIELEQFSTSLKEEIEKRREVQITKLASTAIRKLEKDPAELEGVSIIEIDAQQLMLGITPKTIKKEIEKIHKQRVENVNKALKKLAY